MRADSPGLLVLVIALVAVAGLISAAEAALNGFSRARAQELAEEGRAGAPRLAHVLEDPPPYLNTALFLRLLTETMAVVLATLMVRGSLDGGPWAVVGIAVAVMLVISFVVIGVAPRTLGRQHSERIALASASPIAFLTGILGPVPKLLIVLGNALTPGRGFSEGPFASEAELRELVDLAAESSVIEAGESKMIQSVFELGDTLAREVMVPRTDIVWIERQKTLRQAMSLFLRSGYSRVPVIGEDLDDIVGIAYLKDISRRIFDRHESETTEHVESMMRPVLFVPDSKPVDDLLREMQASRRHIAIVVDEYGGVAGLVTIEDILEEIVGEITDEYDADEQPYENLPDGSVRVSSRYPVDDLGDLVGVPIEEDEVDSVGGLMAKLLGKVPIPGSTVEHNGLLLRAEEAKGRRKKVGTVLIRLVAPEQPDEPAAEVRTTASP